MAKVQPNSKNEIAKAASTEIAVSEVPEFLRPAEGQTAMVGLETAKQYIRPPRVKVIQKAALPPLSDMFHTGDIVVMDGTGEPTRIAKITLNEHGKPGELGEPIYATPVFFYPEWMKTSPISMRGKEPFIRERTLDPTSRLAALAQNPNTWFEAKPGETKVDKKDCIRNIEVLNFIVYLHGLPDFEDRLVCIPYARGGHRAGTAFIEKLNKRKCSHMCGNIFELKSTHQPDKGQGDWFNLEAYQPSEGAPYGAFIQDHALFLRLCAEHDVYKAAHKSRSIVVEHDEEEVIDTYANDPKSEY